MNREADCRGDAVTEFCDNQFDHEPQGGGLIGCDAAPDVPQESGGTYVRRVG